MAKAKETELNEQQGALLQAWTTAEQQLTAIKAQEMELRNRIVLELGFDPKKLEGVQTLALPHGWKLKCQKVQNYSLINDQGETLALLNTLGSKRPDLAQSLAKWKPEMSKTGYNNLLKEIDALDAGVEPTQSIKFLLAKALIIKPGAPQLELVPPEPEKV